MPIYVDVNADTATDTHPDTATANSPVTENLTERFRRIDGPDHRWRCAEKIATGDATWLVDACDQQVLKAAEYLRQSQRDPESSFAGQPDSEIGAAYATWQQETTQRMLKLLVLGNCTMAEITSRLGLNEALVRLIEELFFDVRSLLASPGWIHAQVIRPTEQWGDKEWAQRLRAAYCGGPVVAAAIIEADERVPFDEVDRIMDQETLMHLKLKTALEMPLNNGGNAVRFFEAYLDHEIRKQKLAIEKEKFRHRVDDDLSKREVAKLRIEANSERAQIKSAEKIRLAELRLQQAQIDKMLREMPMTPDVRDVADIHDVSDANGVSLTDNATVPGATAPNRKLPAAMLASMSDRRCHGRQRVANTVRQCHARMPGRRIRFRDAKEGKTVKVVAVAERTR